MTARILVLGTAQDGGVPHAGCDCAACAAAYRDDTRRRRVASIAVVGASGRTLLVDATPDLRSQLHRLALAAGRDRLAPDALLITHAHVGHYLGLAFLGREAMNVRETPLWATASMEAFLCSNKPWSWLVERGQAVLRTLRPDHPVDFDGVRITPFLAPHRGEDTDTVGLRIEGAARRLLYLPDADELTPDLIARIRGVDVALVDGTFYDPSELPGRDLAEIPHPFVADSVAALADAAAEVWFTHLNHSNALIHPDAGRRPELPPGFGVLEDGAAFSL